MFTECYYSEEAHISVNAVIIIQLIASSCTDTARLRNLAIMGQSRWWEFKAKFSNWLKKNYLKPKDVDKTYLAMQAGLFRTAPHVFQPVFEAMFGPIDPQFLTPDISEKCNEIRRNYSLACRDNKVLRLEPWIAQQAIVFTNRQFGLEGARFTPLSPEIASSNLPGDTSSGAPDYHSPKREELPRVLSAIKMLFEGRVSLPSPVDFWPITLAWRTQMRQTGEKHRLIAMYPQFVTVLEAVFFSPILEYLNSRKGEIWYSIGCCWMDNSKVWELMQGFKYVIEIDYDTFDQSVRNQLIHLFYFNFKSFLELDAFHSSLYDWIAYYHMEASILNQYDGQIDIITDKRGVVLSGSYVTNLADSWINLFVLSYSLIKLGHDPADYLARVQGDDTILAGNTGHGPDLLDALGLLTKETFGMSISKTKSAIRQQGEPFFYMGFLMNNQFKYMSEDLIKRKLTLTGRYIPETVLPNKMVVWSKFCSICSASSNGYKFWLAHKQQLLEMLDIDEPSYFHDLSESQTKSFSIHRIVENAEEYVKHAWMYS